MQCPSQKCGSSNVQLLSHYRASLPPSSALYTAYAPPTRPDGGFGLGLALVAIGVLMLVAGYLIGLAVVAGGGLWLFGVYKTAEEIERRRAAWENVRICLACTERWTP